MIEKALIDFGYKSDISCNVVFEIQLAYGRDLLSSVLMRRGSLFLPRTEHESPLNDFEIGAALDDPIASPPIDELVSSDDSVLIVVSDATRATASAQIVNLLCDVSSRLACRRHTWL